MGFEKIMIEFYDRLASWDLGKNVFTYLLGVQVKLPAIILGVIKFVYTVVSKPELS